jgi:hypothetical protein
MVSGINILCKRVFGQILITNKPYCLINNAEQRELDWNNETFIQLQPNIDCQISVQFPYLGKACGPAKLIVKLQPEEIQSYQYKTPFVVTSKGKITRLK